MIVREPEVRMNFPRDSHGVKCIENKELVEIVL